MKRTCLLMVWLVFLLGYCQVMVVFICDFVLFFVLAGIVEAEMLHRWTDLT